MVCLANKDVPLSPKQKLAIRHKLIHSIYDEYFRNESTFEYYYILHNIDLYKSNRRDIKTLLPEMSGAA